MTNWIENVCEPVRLILCWQAPDHLGARYRWAVGEITQRSEGATLRYFDAEGEFKEYNDGKSFGELSQLGYEGYPAFHPRKSLHESGVLEALMRRTPPRSRSDFTDYLTRFRYRSTRPITDFALLGLTEAKLPSDGFSVVNELDGRGCKCELVSEIAGYRYYAQQLDLRDALGQKIEATPEPANKHDSEAVVFKWRGNTLGYVNRLQTRAFHTWLAERRVSCYLDRLNGNSNKPRAYVFVKVEGACS